MSAAGPAAQREYPSARNAAFAANAMPSWAEVKTGRAALTTAIVASAVTMLTLWASVAVTALGRGGGGLAAFWRSTCLLTNCALNVRLHGQQQAASKLENPYYQAWIWR